MREAIWLCSIVQPGRATLANLRRLGGWNTVLYSLDDAETRCCTWLRSMF